MFLYASLVLLALVGVWLFAMRRDSGPIDERDARRLHDRWIIGGGLVLPLVSITALLVVGIPAGHGMLPSSTEEERVVEIHVTGHQWWWDVHYPATGVRLANELRIPAGEPVDIHLMSADVIHSFWVPRLSGKLDAIPGRRNVLRLHADEPGVYRGQCAEFCGLNHARMQFRIRAYERAAFDEWLEGARRND